MSGWALAGISFGGFLVLYTLFVAVLLAVGRREHARAFAGFVPDCAVLFGRVLRDPAVPRRHKAVLGVAAGYLALPLDLVPDFIPVVGQLDDALVVALALRFVVRRGGVDLVERHWPGPRSSLAVVLRLAGRGSGRAN